MPQLLYLNVMYDHVGNQAHKRRRVGCGKTSSLVPKHYLGIFLNSWDGGIGVEKGSKTQWSESE